MDKVIIKHQDLNRVLDDCHEHIANLLKKSVKYYNNKDYPISIFICIIAFEEIGKFEIFGSYQREFKDVLKLEMERLRNHKYKLTQFMEMERLREIKVLKKQSEIDDINKSAEYLKEQFRAFNTIKQIALYYNYHNGNTITLESYFMRHDITENNLAHFNHVLYELVEFRFFLAVLRKQCGNIDGIIDTNNEMVKQNKNYHHIQEYKDKTKTNKYKESLIKFQNTLLELEKLVDYLKKD